MVLQTRCVQPMMLLVIVGIFLATAWHPGMAYEAMEVQNGGRVTGMVKFVGTAPAVEQLPITRDETVCGTGSRPSDALVVSANGGVQYAVVSLANITKGKPQPSTPDNPRLVQEKCWFTPHVLLVPAGSTVDLFNHDKVMHNIHTTSAKNPVINKAHPSFRKRLRFSLNEPEVVKVRCDMHAWMSAWFVVTDHPYYAVTDAQGAFTLTDIPPGTYTLQVWHETLGQQTQEVTVRATSDAKTVVEFK